MRSENCSVHTLGKHQDIKTNCKLVNEFRKLEKFYTKYKCTSIKSEVQF